MNRVEIMECIDNLRMNGQKGIHSEYKDLVSQIKRLSNARAYRYFEGVNSMNQLLVQKLGIKNSTASELLKVARKFYDENGIINPCFKGYEYSKLLKIASFGDISYLEELHQIGIINNDMTRDELVNRIREYNLKIFAEENKKIHEMFSRSL